MYNDALRDWANRHPAAAADLIASLRTDPNVQHDGRSEAWAQQQVRLQVAKHGARAWRNNVGATKAKTPHTCPRCSFKFEVKAPPTRYGLCNDSPELNAVIKSSDLICCIPRLIQPHHVGQTLGQFGAVEVKKPGWKYNPNDPHMAAQAAWLSLIASLGGYATFSTGVIEL